VKLELKANLTRQGVTIASPVSTPKLQTLTTMQHGHKIVKSAQKAKLLQRKLLLSTTVRVLRENIGKRTATIVSTAILDSTLRQTAVRANIAPVEKTTLT